MGGDVDAIWASLKANTAPSQHAARAKALLRDARGDSSSQSTTRADRRRDASGTRPSYEHSVTGARGPEATDVHHPEREASDASRRVETRDVETERVSPSRASSDPPDEDVEDGSGTTFEDRSATVATEDALRRLTARDLNVLADTQSAPQTRVRASRHLREVLETRVEPALLAATAAELFLKPFLRRLEDASERCRESAADALAVLVRGIAACPGEDERGAVLDLLPYAVPVLRDRLGPVDEAPLSASDVLAGEPNASASASRARTDPREPSEEIRAKLHRVFRELLVNASQSSGNSLAAYASDAVLVLQFTAEDAFWEVAHEACVLLEALCHELGRRLSPVAKKLAWTFAPNLTHRRSKVRVATLRALRALMHCGAHETILDLCAFKHPNLVPIKAFYGEDRKVNYFGKLALDSCAPVRLAFVETLGDWMTTLVERADHEPRLLPYVMSAAADEAAAVRDAAAALLAALGAQYEREHEKDLKATMTYAPEHFGVEHSLGRDDSDGGDTSDPGDEEPRVLLYPPPFASRPGLGARVLVKNNFPAVVNPILAEMMGWQEDARVRASKLLRANLVFLEENATQHCQQLCLAFVKVCALTRRDAASMSKPRLGTQSDSGASRAADVEPTVAQCCALVGAFVKPDEWLEVLLERCGPGNEPATVAGALAVTAECCAGAAAEDMLRETTAGGASCPCDRILDVLEHPSLVGSSDTAARSSVCRFAETVLSRRPRTWGGGGRRESTGNRRLARLLGAALRAGAGEETESPGDEAAEPARACRAAFAAAARALGTRSANARFDETRARNEMMARLRGELLAPLAALPRGAWRARDAAALAAICGSGDAASGGVAFDAEDASTAIRLVALVAEARAFEKARSKKRFPLAALVRFPFLETLEHSRIRDEDIATVFSTTLSTLTSTLASRTSIDADAIAVASNAVRATATALRREACSDAAARAAAGAVAARAVAILESLQDGTSAQETPAFLRAQVCALAGTLANRLTVASKTKTKEPSVLAAPRVLARLVPALAARLDDADAATRDAAAAALAALAAAAPLAAYHCVRAATAAHFVEEGARADARRGSAAILAAAHEAHPSATAAAVARHEGGGAARAARAALAAEAGVSALGAFADADAALEGGLLPYARFREARDSDARVAPGEATEEARRRDAPTALFGLD